LFLEDTNGLPRELLSEKLKVLAEERVRHEREVGQLRAQLAAVKNLAQDMEQVRVFCGQVATGIDLFTEEDRRWTMDVLNIQATVPRGAARAEDMVVLSGHIPALEAGGIGDTSSPSQVDAGVGEGVQHVGQHVRKRHDPDQHDGQREHNREVERAADRRYLVK
jgi:hypothetical protein